MPNKDYTPIACSTYDQLEALAVKKTMLEIEFIDDDETALVQDIIVDFQTVDKEEFLILKSGKRIRLDHMIRFQPVSSK